MCDRCRAISWEINAHQRRRRTVDDPTALALIDEVIEDLKTEKAALHPDQPEDDAVSTP